MQVETVIWEFDLLNEAGKIPANMEAEYPHIEAGFVGIAPAVAYSVDNQPKFARGIERQMKQIERDVRTKYQKQLAHLAQAELRDGLATLSTIITDYQQRIASDLLIDGQLDLENLSIAGNWPLLWRADAPLVTQKNTQRADMPFG